MIFVEHIRQKFVFIQFLILEFHLFFGFEISYEIVDFFVERRQVFGFVEVFVEFVSVVVFGAEIDPIDAFVAGDVARDGAEFVERVALVRDFVVVVQEFRFVGNSIDGAVVDFQVFFAR